MALLGGAQQLRGLGRGESQWTSALGAVERAKESDCNRAACCTGQGPCCGEGSLGAAAAARLAPAPQARRKKLKESESHHVHPMKRMSFNMVNGRSACNALLCTHSNVVPQSPAGAAGAAARRPPALEQSPSLRTAPAAALPGPSTRSPAAIAVIGPSQQTDRQLPLPPSQLAGRPAHTCRCFRSILLPSPLLTPSSQSNSLRPLASTPGTQPERARALRARSRPVVSAEEAGARWSARAGAAS